MANSRALRAPPQAPADPKAPRARTLSPRIKPPDPPVADELRLTGLLPTPEIEPPAPLPAPEEFTDEEILRAPPPWIVHPQACGGCGAKALTERGLGTCTRCGWQKPPRERAALARRLENNPALARRLAMED